MVYGKHRALREIHVQTGWFPSRRMPCVLCEHLRCNEVKAEGGRPAGAVLKSTSQDHFCRLSSITTSLPYAILYCKGGWLADRWGWFLLFVVTSTRMHIHPLTCVSRSGGRSSVSPSPDSSTQAPFIWSLHTSFPPCRFTIACPPPHPDLRATFSLPHFQPGSTHCRYTRRELQSVRSRLEVAQYRRWPRFARRKWTLPLLVLR